MESNYSNFTVLIRGGKNGSFFIEMVATSYEAMLADIKEAYTENVEVITWSQR